MMELMREAWSDDRLDDLNRRVENGFNRVDADIRELRSEMNARFDRVDARFDRIDARFDAMQRLMIQVGGVIAAALIGLIATQI
jgi:tetrahydromethanopterin S-methyltransferase subunit G